MHFPKVNTPTYITAPREYDDEVYCLETLMDSGVFGQKVHYSSEGQRKVLVRISLDMKNLVWISLPGKGFFARGKTSSIRIADIKG